MTGPHSCGLERPRPVAERLGWGSEGLLLQPLHLQARLPPASSGSAGAAAASCLRPRGLSALPRGVAVSRLQHCPLLRRRDPLALLPTLSLGCWCRGQVVPCAPHRAARVLRFCVAGVGTRQGAA